MGVEIDAHMAGNATAYCRKIESYVTTRYFGKLTKVCSCVYVCVCKMRVCVLRCGRCAHGRQCH